MQVILVKPRPIQGWLPPKEGELEQKEKHHIINLDSDDHNIKSPCAFLMQSGMGVNFLTEKINPMKIDDIFTFKEAPGYVFVVRWFKKKPGRSKFMEMGVTVYSQEDYDQQKAELAQRWGIITTPDRYEFSYTKDE